MSINISELDPAMAVRPATANGIAWYLPFEEPFKLCGFSWFAKEHKFERLPVTDRPAEVTRYVNGVAGKIPAKDCGALLLSPHTAGGQVRFRTDSTCFMLQGKLLATGGMDHMAFTGSAGFDLYLKSEGVWKCLGVTRTDHSKLEFSATICAGLKHEMRDVIINFPLYNGVRTVSIGLDENAKVEAPTPFANPRPVVLYGTSIEQGGCASRPGMAGSNILSRMLERQVINLGFSGNGRGEPEIAAMLADVQDAGMYLIEYGWNVSVPELAATLPQLLDIIRAKHPDVPIVLVAPTPGREQMPEYANPSMRFAQQTEIMQKEAAKRQQAGDKAMFFFDAWRESMGDDYWECTVDGAHMTDLGFLRWAQAIYPFLKDK